MSLRGKKLVEMALQTPSEQGSLVKFPLQHGHKDQDLSDDNSTDTDFSSGSSDVYVPSSSSLDSIAGYSGAINNVDENQGDLLSQNGGLQPMEPDDKGPKNQEPRTRKRSRKANKSMWKRSVVKKLRISGKAYTNRSGKSILAKSPRPVDCSKCRFKCGQKFRESVRSQLCSEYWGLADDRRQKIHLTSLITEKPVSRRKALAEKERNTSREYYLQNSTGERKRVCLKFLCATLAISHRVVETCMKKVSSTGMYTGHDGRSERNTAQHNATPEEQKNHVKAHIDSFPRVESHYCHRDSKKLYLAPDLNLSIMFRLYRETYCPENNIQPVSLFVYRSIFNAYDPALSFYIPKKDQCSTCNAYQAAADKVPLQDDWNKHKEREMQSMQMKAQDKKRTIDNGGVTIRHITFDMQAILTLPYAGDSQIYYKCKLNVYNFTIMDASKNDGYCYLWDECNGRKGNIEIGSCLLKYIFSLPVSVSHLTTFSDTCGGQNRNQFVTTAMLYAVNKKEGLEIIDLKFMESGHSYLEVDSMHATIERKRKHMKVYTTREWALVISAARINPRPYLVNVMHYDDFYDIKKLTEKVVSNVTVTVDGQKVNWMKMKWIRLQKTRSFIIQFKYDLSEETFSEIDVRNCFRKRTRVEKKEEVSWSNVSLESKYGQKLPISEGKKNDLRSLLTSRVIPEEYRYFIEALLTAKRVVNEVSEDESDS